MILSLRTVFAVGIYYRDPDARMQLRQLNGLRRKIWFRCLTAAGGEDRSVSQPASPPAGQSVSVFLFWATP